MSDQQAFDQLKDFFENRPVSAQAADSLRKGVEIGVVINNNLSCAFFKDNNRPCFEKREAKNPDVIFYMQPEAIQALINDPSNEIGEIGINIVRNYLAGLIRIKVRGSMINLLTNGYLGVIKSGGITFAKYLAAHGIQGLGKIKDIIEKMRKQS